MYVFPILDWNFKIPSLKSMPQGQKHTFYSVKCMFLGQSWFSGKSMFGSCQIWKNIHLHCKMYVFPVLDWNFKIPSFKLEPQSQKHTFLHCKMYVFPILDWNFKIPSLKLKPQSQKHTFYSVKCMFLEGQLLEDKILKQFLNIFDHFWPFLRKHTFYTVKCMFLLFRRCVKKSMFSVCGFWGLPKKYVIQCVIQYVLWSSSSSSSSGRVGAWWGLLRAC